MPYRTLTCHRGHTIRTVPIKGQPHRCHKCDFRLSMGKNISKATQAQRERREVKS